MLTICTISDLAQKSQAKILNFRLSPEHRHADFFFDVEYSGFIFREIQGRHDKQGRILFYMPAVVVRRPGFEKAHVPAIWFSGNETRETFQAAARLALVAYMASNSAEVCQ